LHNQDQSRLRDQDQDRLSGWDDKF
jgi:hypothetical protein